MEETGVINVIGSIDLYETADTNNENAILSVGAISNKPSINSINVGDV